MAAAFDRVEVVLRLIDLILPDCGGGPCLSCGELLGGRKRCAVTAAFAGRRPDTPSIRIAALREASERRTAKTRARVGQHSLVVRLAAFFARFPRAAERHGGNDERRAG